MPRATNAARSQCRKSTPWDLQLGSIRGCPGSCYGDFNLSYHRTETIFFTIDPCYGNLNKNPLTRTQLLDVRLGHSKLPRIAECEPFAWRARRSVPDLNTFGHHGVWKFKSPREQKRVNSSTLEFPNLCGTPLPAFNTPRSTTFSPGASRFEISRGISSEHRLAAPHLMYQLVSFLLV